MPAKNSLKQYVPGGFYHLYNRGVEKRKIFLDREDYHVFLRYLKVYLSPKEKILEEIKMRNDWSDERKAKEILELASLSNFYNKIELFSFVLMENHFHLQLRQKESNDIERFMRALSTRYVKYFNEKNQRIGPLFQGRYKGVLIEKEEYLLHLSRYIHLNPKEIIGRGKNLVSYPWSSYSYYLGKFSNLSWVKKDTVLSYFKKVKGHSFSSYQGFVEGYKEEGEEETNFYKKLLLDAE